MIFFLVNERIRIRTINQVGTDPDPGRLKISRFGALLRMLSEVCRANKRFIFFYFFQEQHSTADFHMIIRDGTIFGMALNSLKGLNFKGIIPINLTLLFSDQDSIRSVVY